MATQTLPPPTEQVETPPAEESWLSRNQDLLLISATGLAIGGFGVWLSVLGNPRNAGICISCYMENLAGALNLDGNLRMAYVRPELIGFVVGAALIALLGREFRSEGGSSPVLRFLGGGRS